MTFLLFLIILRFYHLILRFYLRILILGEFDDVFLRLFSWLLEREYGSWGIQR